MSLAELWDRAWWGCMIAIFVGLVWLKFLDPYLSCLWTGVIVAVACGALYFYVGVRRMRKIRDAAEAEEEQHA